METRDEGENKAQDTTAEKWPEMEDKRLTGRHTMALDTEVHFQEQYVKGMFRCRTGNIGSSGVFLPSEKMPIISKTDIELVFYAHSRFGSEQYRINARVVRTSADGAALVFCLDDDDEEKLRDFRRFLREAKVANQQ